MISLFLKKRLEKNSKAESEIYPELYVKRDIERKVNAFLDFLGTAAIFAMLGVFFVLWLVYEGWITPETIKGIF